MDTGGLGVMPCAVVGISGEGGPGSTKQGWSHLAKVQALL